MFAVCAFLLLVVPLATSGVAINATQSAIVRTILNELGCVTAATTSNCTLKMFDSSYDCSTSYSETLRCDSKGNLTQFYV